MIQATDGRLYGTTIYTAFRMPLSGPATTLTALNGVSSAALIEASDGKFYGTTSLLFAGAEFGTIFSLDAAGSLTTLHRFDTDGRHPRSRVIEGLNGSLYGTTSQGGTFGYGTVFKFDPAGTLTTLHHFAGADGANPYAGLLAASDGRFYGTTRNGGAFGNGTIFTIDTTGTLTTLHSFAPSDGMFPVADLIQASDGHVYGTTVSGGPYNGGVVFRVRLATSPPDQYVEIVSRHSGQCLDVSGASTDAAASVIQWPCHGGPNQQWRLEPAGGGAFRIIARHSGQVARRLWRLRRRRHPDHSVASTWWRQPGVDARARVRRLHAHRRAPQWQGAGRGIRIGRRWRSGDPGHASRRCESAVAPPTGGVDSHDDHAPNGGRSMTTSAGGQALHDQPRSKTASCRRVRHRPRHPAHRRHRPGCRRVRRGSSPATDA